MSDLDQTIARQIIETVGSSGQPPEYGFQNFTVGLDDYLNIINSEYLASFIRQGGSSFKMVVGVFGGGKTHFLYSVRDLTWRNQFALSYVSLKPGESPFHKLEKVYSAIVLGIVPPLSPQEILAGYERGIVSFIRTWYSRLHRDCTARGLRGDELTAEMRSAAEQLDGIESLSFAKAVKAAFYALLEHNDDDFLNICQWLTGEGYDRRIHGKFGILQKIDRSTAFMMLRSLTQWVRQIGYSGLVVLLDEAERTSSLSTSQIEQHLGNLRELVDECSHTAFQGVMIFYAVPDENFLDGRTNVYEALKQRVSTVLDELNPTGVKIELDNVVTGPKEFLISVGEKLAAVYETAYGCQLATKDKSQVIQLVADTAYDLRFGDTGYKRLFVQTLIKGLNFLRIKGVPPTVDNLQGTKTR